MNGICYRLIFAAALGTCAPIERLSAQNVGTQSISDNGSVRAELRDSDSVSVEYTASRETIKTFTLNHNARTVALDATGGTIYVGGEDGGVRAYGSTTGRAVWINDRLTSDPIIALSRWDDEVLFVDERSGIFVVSAKDGSLVVTVPALPASDPVPVAAQLLPDSVRLLLADGTIRSLVWGSTDWQAFTPPADQALLALRSVPFRTIQRRIYKPPPEPMIVCDGLGKCSQSSVNVEAGYQTITSRVPQHSVENDKAFPYPPPPTRTSIGFDGADLRAAGFLTFGSLASEISAGISDAYGSLPLFFAYDGGAFAAVAQLENIDESGVPLSPRFSDDRKPSVALFSRAFWDRFVGREKREHYRVIAFVVDTVGAVGSVMATEADARAYFLGGVHTKLKNELADEAITDAHRLSVLVYIFRRENEYDVAKMITLDPGPVEHLEKADVSLRFVE